MWADALFSSNQYLELKWEGRIVNYQSVPKGIGEDVADTLEIWINDIFVEKLVLVSST